MWGSSIEHYGNDKYLKETRTPIVYLIRDYDALMMDVDIPESNSKIDNLTLQVPLGLVNQQYDKDFYKKLL